MRLVRTLALVLALAAFPAAAQEGALRILGVAPLQAEGAEAWLSGVHLAEREINARGGILGRPVVVFPADSVAGARVPYHLILSHHPLAPAPGATTVPQIAIARPASSLGKIAWYAAERLQARVVAVIAPSAEDRAALAVRLAARGIRAVEIPVEEHEVDFSAAVIRLRNSGADALVVLVRYVEIRWLLQELRRQGYDRPVVGGAGLATPVLVELAGDAANGLRFLIGLDPETPIPAVRETLRKPVYRTPGHNLEFLRGYATLYAAKALAARAGRIDRAAFASVLHRQVLEVRAEPGLLLDAAGTGGGALDHETLVFEIRQRQPVIIDSLPPGAG